MSTQCIYREGGIDRSSMHIAYLIDNAYRHILAACQEGGVQMSYATSRPLVNKFFGGIDVAASLRAHLLANTNNLKIERFRNAANSVAAAVRVHPRRITKVMRRFSVLARDLVN